VWLEGTPIAATVAGMHPGDQQAERGKKVRVAYLNDKALGIAVCRQGSMR
jgi:hypothetical protein